MELPGEPSRDIRPAVTANWPGTNPSVWGAAHPMGHLDFFDFVPLCLHLKGVNLALILLYLTCSIGFTGENFQKISSLLAFIHCIKDPWIVLGDLNVSPSTLLAQTWFQDMGLQVLVPTNFEVGPTGSLIDFAFAPRPPGGVLPHVGRTRMAISGARTKMEGWRHAAEHWNGAGAEQGLDLAPCVCTSNLYGSVVSMNGLESSTLSPVPLPGPVFAATWCGQTPALTPFAVDAQRMRSRQIFTASGRAQQTSRLTELRRVNICWPKPAAIGSHARSFGSEDASREPGLKPRMSRNLPWPRSRDLGHTTLHRCTLFPVFTGQEMVREGSSQRIHVIAVVGMDLLWSVPMGV